MGANLLLVDKVDRYRAVVADNLVAAGFKVVQTGTAQEALTEMEDTKFAAVIVDNQLPDKSGLELLLDIKEIDSEAKTILIVAPDINIDTTQRPFTLKNAPLITLGPLHPNIVVKKVTQLLTEELKPAQTTSLIDEPFGSSLAPGKKDPSKQHVKQVASQQFTAIRRSYQQRLPIELKNLKEFLDEAKKFPKRESAWLAIFHATHALHGTAGTLGFNEVSDAAKNIDLLSNELRKDGADVETLWNNIETTLRRAVTSPDHFSLMPDGDATAYTKNIASIMIIDQDKDVLAKMKVEGRLRSIEIITADGREQALMEATVSNIDGVIIDLCIGDDWDAFALSHELRSINNKEHLSVAFMSNDSSMHNRIAAAAAGSSHFLEKPLDGDDLEELGHAFVALRNETSSKILVVDDDEYFRKHIISIMEKEEMEAVGLDNGKDVLKTLEQVKPDLMLLDVNMPDVSGYDICRMIRSVTAWKNLPILFLTAEITSDARIKCFKVGGDDYIEKPVIKEELLARISVRLERVRLFSERADKDPLTTLFNRRAFLDRFKIHLNEGERYDRKMSFCMIDLDHFKQVNDTHGHMAGDQVLSAFGKLLSGRFRTVDLRGRWGGEEFAVSIYGEDAKTSQEIIEHVLQTMQSMSFEGESNETFKVTFSAGISTYPTDAKTFAELFRVADERLYKAKELGRNRIEI